MITGDFHGSLHRRIDEAPAVHRLDAPTPEQIVSAANDIRSTTFVADQASWLKRIPNNWWQQ
jgi:hypothetical protein